MQGGAGGLAGVRGVAKKWNLGVAEVIHWRSDYQCYVIARAVPGSGAPRENVQACSGYSVEVTCLAFSFRRLVGPTTETPLSGSCYHHRLYRRSKFPLCVHTRERRTIAGHCLPPPRSMLSHRERLELVHRLSALRALWPRQSRRMLTLPPRTTSTFWRRAIANQHECQSKLHTSLNSSVARYPPHHRRALDHCWNETPIRPSPCVHPRSVHPRSKLYQRLQLPSPKQNPRQTHDHPLRL